MSGGIFRLFAAGAQQEINPCRTSYYHQKCISCDNVYSILSDYIPCSVDYKGDYRKYPWRLCVCKECFRKENADIVYYFMLELGCNVPVVETLLTHMRGRTFYVMKEKDEFENAKSYSITFISAAAS